MASVILSERDYLAVLAVTRSLSEVRDPDEFDAVVLGQIDTLVRSDVSSINDVDPEANRVRYLLHPADFPMPVDSMATFLRHADVHPLIAYATRTGDGSAQRISDFLTTEEWHANAMYQEFYAPIGIEHQISFTLTAPQPLLVAIALNRGEHDFDERDRAVLNLARPFLAQSWRNARERTTLRSLLSGSLAEGATGAILPTDPLQELVPGSLTALYRFFGRPGPSDPLPHRVARWAETQRAISRSVDDLQLARPLSARVDDRRLLLRYLPRSQQQDEVIVLREAGEEGAEHLRAVGLTAREAEVLQLVATGATNAQVATELHVAASTVKRHLDHVYAKLGVSGRLQAAGVARDLVAHHGELPRSPPFGG